MRQALARGGVALIVAALAACASAPPAPVAPDVRAALYHDAAFKPPSEVIDPARLFALTPQMEAYYVAEIEPMQRRRGQQRGLIDALYSSRQLMLSYDNAYTRSAAQAFDARAGNCMSLVLMTAAFAKRAGMPVRFQNVYVDPVWGRQGDLHFTFGHVNISLGGPLTRVAGVEFGRSDWLTIDFLPQSDLRGQRYLQIEESTLVAMYLNNKAAEALAAGRIDDAYWWSRQAIEHDPQLVIAYNTLGVVYRRHGDSDAAERVLRFAYAREPRNITVVGNLAQLLADSGRKAESQAMFELLATLQPEPPFKALNEGIAAMQRGAYREAKALFERELDRDPEYHETHYWLALAHLQLGDLSRARKHMAAAAETSGTRDQQARYSAKLTKLKAASVH